MEINGLINQAVISHVAITVDQKTIAPQPSEIPQRVNESVE